MWRQGNRAPLIFQSTFSYLPPPTLPNQYQNFVLISKARNWACKVPFSPMRLKDGHFDSSLLSWEGPLVWEDTEQSLSQRWGWLHGQWSMVSAPLLKHPSQAFTFSCKLRAWFLHPPSTPIQVFWVWKKIKQLKKLKGTGYVKSFRALQSHPLILPRWAREMFITWLQLLGLQLPAGLHREAFPFLSVTSLSSAKEPTCLLEWNAEVRNSLRIDPTLKILSKKPKTQHC